MRDLDALRVFETPRPKSGHKFGAIKTLLQLGVPRAGIGQMILRAPWPDENKAKWLAQLNKIASATVACPFCVTDGSEEDCEVGEFMAKPEFPEDWFLPPSTGRPNPVLVR